MEDETFALVGSSAAIWIIGGGFAGVGVAEEYSNGLGLLTFSAFLILLSLIFALWAYVRIKNKE